MSHPHTSIYRKMLSTQVATPIAVFMELCKLTSWMFLQSKIV